MAPVASLEPRHTRWHLPAAVLLATGLLCLTSLPVHAQVTTRVSVTSAGAEVSGGVSAGADISADGRFVSFVSRSALLTPLDTNDADDVFVHDRVTRVTSRVSVSSSGAQALGASLAAAISADGRFVAFTSQAPNLVDGDTNMVDDVFLHDRQTGATARVSIGSGGAEALGRSDSPSISGDGKVVAFVSVASNLVPGDTNGVADVFVHDRSTGVTSRVSVRSGGAQSITGEARGPALNTDGRFVAFSSMARDLVAGDTNGVEDVFVHDRVNGQTERVSVSSSGAEGYSQSNDPAIDGSGRLIVFGSSASTLVPADRNAQHDVFLHDRETGVTSRVNLGPGDVESQPGPIGAFSGMADISADGMFVGFYSYAVNLSGEKLQGNPHVYVRDLQAGVTARMDVSFDGAPSTCCNSFNPALSATGRFVAFDSSFTNVVPGDTNKEHDVFVRDIDVDADGLFAPWETLFGLDGLVGTGDDGPGGDPDGDGRTNLDEYRDGTHPRGFHVRYLAEGANSPRFFITSIALLNVHPVNPVVLRFDTGAGSTSSAALQLAGLQRATIRTGDRAELMNTAFSTVIESTHPVVIDRQMTWSERMYGAHAETALPAPSTTWYLAEGATHSHFSLFYLVQNPNTRSVDVTVTYLRPAPAPTLTKTYTVPAQSRFNIWVNDEALRDPALAGLAGTDVSARLVATQPVLVERAMYLDQAGPDGTFGTPDDVIFSAGHGSAAVPAPALQWFLAEGATGPYFDEFILIANPETTPASVDVRYLLTDGTVLTKGYAVPASSRFNIWVNEEEFPGRGKALEEAALSAIVTSVNDVPIIVERAMWWPRPSPFWMEAHNSAGVTATGTVWGLAEGESGGTTATETYILIANTSAYAGTARVTLVYEAGGSESVEVPLPANSRTNVPAIEGWFPGITGKRFGALIESVGDTPAQIVVERAMYSNANGVHWAAGTNATATRLAP